jgi:hypothetical protein
MEMLPHEEQDPMSIRTRLGALEIQHQVLEQELCSAQALPAPDDLKIAELQRRRLLLEDEIAHLQQDIGARAARIKGAATKKRRAAIRAAERKSSSWYEGATRSISIVKTKPI